MSYSELDVVYTDSAVQTSDLKQSLTQTSYRLTYVLGRTHVEVQLLLQAKALDHHSHQTSSRDPVFTRTQALLAKLKNSSCSVKTEWLEYCFVTIY